MCLSAVINKHLFSVDYSVTPIPHSSINNFTKF